MKIYVVLLALVTILLLDLVMIHWIRWKQGKSFKENSNEPSVADWSCMTFENSDEAEEQAIADLFYSSQLGEVYKPEVLTQDTMGEEGVWGKVSEDEVGEWRWGGWGLQTRGADPGHHGRGGCLGQGEWVRSTNQRCWPRIPRGRRVSGTRWVSEWVSSTNQRCWPRTPRARRVSGVRWVMVRWVWVWEHIWHQNRSLWRLHHN